MLKELQESFRDSFHQKNPEFINFIRVAGNLSPQERLDIYRQDVRNKRKYALYNNYPICRNLLGKSDFETLADEFIVKYPSKAPELSKSVENFPDFLDNHQITQKIPYLKDMAKLEKRATELLNMADSPEFDWQRLRQVPQELQGKIIFNLPNASYLFSSHYSLDLIWSNSSKNRDKNSFERLENPIRLLLWCRRFTLRIDRVSEEQWYILQEIEAHQTLKAMSQKLSFLTPTPNIISLIPYFVKQGWITSFNLSQSS